VNPLKWADVDILPRLPGAPPESVPTAEQILAYLHAPEIDRSRPAFLTRYQEIAQVLDPLPVVPAEPTILGKLVWPLRHAKGSYALGNYLGCIALRGMVGEMVAILLWDISKVPLQGHPMTEAEQRAMFGRTFERLGQERKVEVLHTLKLIDDVAKTAFESLRGLRNTYLHFLSKAHNQLPQDALKAYGDALQVVAIVLGPSFDKGNLVLRPDLVAYLTEKGIVGTNDQGA
jgi:hypothetical protein